MAFLNTVAKSLGGEMPTFGGPPATSFAAGGNNPTSNCPTAQAISVLLSAGTGTITFNAFPGPGTLRWAWVRVKSTVVANTTTLTWKVTGTDGTTTQQLIPPSPVTGATTPGTQIDNSAFLYTDLNLTSISVAVTAGTSTATVDIELAGGV